MLIKENIAQVICGDRLPSPSPSPALSISAPQTPSMI
jgi:hypothetical protein